MREDFIGAGSRAQVDRRVRVWWDGNGDWFEADVVGYDSARKLHLVQCVASGLKTTHTHTHTIEPPKEGGVYKRSRGVLHWCAPLRCAQLTLSGPFLVWVLGC